MYSNTDYPAFVWTLILSLSFIIISIISIIFFIKLEIKHGHVSKWINISILYIFTVTISFIPILIKGGLNMDSIYFFRSILMPVFFVILGFVYTNNKEKNFRKLLQFISIISFLGAIFAIIDYFIIPVDFWKNSAGLGKYWIEVKKIDPKRTLEGLPLNFFTRSGTDLLRRAVSFYGDPLAAGYSMSSGIISWILLRFNSKSNKNMVMTLSVLSIIVIGIGLTYTRAAYIIVGVSILYLIIRSKKFRNEFPRIGYLVIAIVIFLLGGKYIHDSLIGGNSSAIVHMDSIKSIKVLLSYPFGTGIYSSAPEGTIQHILWIMGIVPTIIFLYWIYSIKPKKNKFIDRIGCSIIYSLIIVSFISCQMIGTSCAFFWIMLGSILSFNNREYDINL